MPLLIDNMSAEFARFLAENPNARWSMDAALAHVLTLAYERGLDDGRRDNRLPASTHCATKVAEAFEWLRAEATGNDAHPLAGIALDEWHALSTRHALRAVAFDLVSHLHRQRDFSERTFGPGDRAKGVVDHIRKELIEIENNPKDLSEWIDVVLLALDGAWRQGYTPEQIAVALEAKQSKNEGRQWPDWRTAAPGKAIEHVRDEVAQ